MVFLRFPFVLKVFDCLTQDRTLTLKEVSIRQQKPAREGAGEERKQKGWAQGLALPGF